MDDTPANPNQPEQEKPNGPVTAKDLQKLEEQIREEVRTQPRYQEYLSQFNPSSADSLGWHYAYNKSRALFSGKSAEDHIQWRLSQWQEEAEERLWQIQQKKLFNLQCQWRAELVTLPGVEICYDFDVWENRIGGCPFLPPITDEEFETYYWYYSTVDDDNEFGGDGHWQQYEEWKEERIDDSNGITYPDWYEYFDVRRGTGTLLDLPDKRGGKERVYFDRAYDYERMQRIAEGKEPPPYVPDPRPHLSYSEMDQKTMEMMRLFDPPLVTRYYVARERVYQQPEEIEEWLDILFLAEEPVPIDAADDWRTAVVRAGKQFQHEQIAKALREEYARYKQRLDLGIRPEHHHRYGNDACKTVAEHFRKQILLGRSLLGEPEDFNF